MNIEEPASSKQVYLSKELSRLRHQDMSVRTAANAN